MTTAIHLCGPDDADRLLALVERCHGEAGIASDPESRAAGVRPLLDGSPFGAAYVFGPSRAPSGYVIITFGWSTEMGGLSACVNEIWVRPSIRGHGIATEVLNALAPELRDAGVRIITLQADRTGGLFARTGFAPLTGVMQLARVL